MDDKKKSSRLIDIRDWWDPQTAADYLDCSTGTVRSKFYRGEIAGVIKGGGTKRRRIVLNPESVKKVKSQNGQQ